MTPDITHEPGQELHACGKRDCPRLVSPLALFCCTPCAEASAGGYETAAHSPGCDQRAAERGRPGERRG